MDNNDGFTITFVVYYEYQPSNEYIKLSVLYIVFVITNAFSVLNIRSYNRNLSKLNTSHASLISRQDVTCLINREELICTVSIQRII